jgi:phospholipid N-methyltransferase
MQRSPSNGWVFFREFRRNFETTGAIAPSSRRLARRLASYVGQTPAPKRVLEVGPGTGAVTEEILKSLGEQDSLDLVELNDAFVEILRQRFLNDPLFLPAAGRSRVIHQAVQKLPPEPTYDVIVSGLPLNNFPVELVEQILTTLERLLRPGGTLSFFEYIAVRPLRALVAGRAVRQRLRGVGRALDAVIQNHEVRRDAVWINLPPAWVHHVRWN